MIYGDGSHCPFKYAIMMLLRIWWLERLEDIFAFEYRGIGRKLVQLFTFARTWASEDGMPQ
jgi:hypothetical protein